MRSLLPLLLGLTACGSLPASAALTASATIQSTPLGPNNFHYDLILKDTGTTNVGTFWFAWVPGEDFMQTKPANVASPANWTPTITGGTPNDGFAIRWVAQAGSALTPGTSLAGFGFDSATTPAQMAANSPFLSKAPVTTSVVYSAGPFSDSGFQFTLTAAVASSVPEPSTFAPLVFAFALAWGRKRRLTAPR